MFFIFVVLSISSNIFISVADPFNFNMDPDPLFHEMDPEPAPNPT